MLKNERKALRPDREDAQVESKLPVVEEWDAPSQPCATRAGQRGEIVWMTRDGHQCEGRQYVDDHSNCGCSAEPSCALRGRLTLSQSMARAGTHDSPRNELTRISVQDGHAGHPRGTSGVW